MKTLKKNPLKYLLQWGMLAGIVVAIVVFKIQNRPFDPEKYCPFGGLQALGSYLNNHTLACCMSMLQIMMGVVLAVGVILFGKLFCGYLCPLGTLGEAMGDLGRKMKINFTIPAHSAADSILRIVKYVLLFVVFYLSITSSELFCKNFDPYYAMASGFKGEINLWMAVGATALLIVGSLCIKMFWCKYICPLGALNNIFKFTYIFLGATLVCLIFGLSGVRDAWIWILAVTCLVCYVIEIVRHRSCTFPLLTIRRDAEKCSDCGLCRKRCPYDIRITDHRSVRNIDCTLCGDCVASCGTEALSIGGKKRLRWMPGAILAVLLTIALIVGNSVELPTIDERWGEPADTAVLTTYEIAGLQTIRCFGSSKAFSSKMQAVAGVYGVKTFVRRHAVVVTYDPSQTTTEEIDRAVFTPTKRKLRSPDAAVGTLKIIRIGIEGIRDRMDNICFGAILSGMPEIYGFVSRFACPVDIVLYVDPDARLDRKKLEETIGTDEITVGTKSFAVHFELKSFEDNGETVLATSFLELMEGK